jgi:hypothetical protein
VELHLATFMGRAARRRNNSHSLSRVARQQASSLTASVHGPPISVS